ncbi:MAG: aminomethyltransferase beta-barrel domain-containing protein, partial [Anaerovoracaceae bacterium]
VMCKIIYAAKPASAVIERAYDDMVCVSFDEPQRAPAPGQSLVIYSDGMVIGGGFIELSE